MPDAANRVTRLPYQLSDGSDIFEAYRARTGEFVETAELRITIGGWVSQTLLHTANPANISEEDIVPYIVDKGYKVSEMGPARLIRALQESQQLSAQYMPRYGTWTLTPRVTPLKYDVQLLRRRVWDTVADPASLAFRSVITPHMWYVNGRLPVAIWPDTDAKRTFLEMAANVAKMGELNPEVRYRTLHPLEWFQTVLAECGFREDEMKFAGYIGCNDRTVTPGVTEVRGPADITGVCPRFQFPAHDSAQGLVIPLALRTNSDVSDSACQFSVNGKAWSFGDAAFNEARTASGYTPRVTLQLNDLGTGQTIDPSADATFNGKISTRPIVTAAYLPLPEAVVQSLRGATAGVFADASAWVVNHVEEPARSSTLNCVMVSKKWRIAKPLTLLDFKIPEPTIVIVKAVENEMKIIELRAPIMGVTMPFESLRDMARSEIARNGTEVDKVGLQKFLADSEAFSDALVYTTFYDRPFTPVSMGNVEALELVKKANKAGENILDSLIDDKQTLRQLARRVDAASQKGVKYSAFSNVVDEVAAVESLISPYVGDRLAYASGFVLTAEVDALGVPSAIYGTFGPEAAVALSPLEASLLRVRGAVDNVPKGVWDALGVTDVTTEDLVSYGNVLMAGSKKPPSWKEAAARKWDVMTPREFCTRDGYPVANYTDLDT